MKNEAEVIEKSNPLHLQLTFNWLFVDHPRQTVIRRFVLTQCRRLGRLFHIKIKVKISVFSSTVFYDTKLIDHKRFMGLYLIQMHIYKCNISYLRSFVTARIVNAIFRISKSFVIVENLTAGNIYTTGIDPMIRKLNDLEELSDYREHHDR